MLIAVVIAAALWLMLDRTRLGAMIRAGVDDAPMARVIGIRVSRLFTIVFCLGAGLAGFAGVIGGPILSVYPGLDADMLPLALIVVILGGTGSLLGALLGSFIIGFLYNFGQALFPELAYIILFLPMLLVLVLRPAGPVRPAGAMTARVATALALLVLATLPLLARQRLLRQHREPDPDLRVFALGLNVLVGYAGLVSLGHAGLFGVAAMPPPGWSPPARGSSWAALGALAVTVAVAARSSRCWRCAPPASAS